MSNEYIRKEVENLIESMVLNADIVSRHAVLGGQALSTGSLMRFHYEVGGSEITITDYKTNVKILLAYKGHWIGGYHSEWLTPLEADALASTATLCDQKIKVALEASRRRADREAKMTPAELSFMNAYRNFTGDM